jgi:hypothetical protein
MNLIDRLARLPWVGWIVRHRFLKFGTVGASGTAVNLGVLYLGQEFLFTAIQPFETRLNASLALAETVASLGATANIDRQEFVAVGLEINANHLRAMQDGVVTATGTPIHIGRTTQVWDIRIVDEADRPVCVSRCTLAVRPKR